MVFGEECGRQLLRGDTFTAISSSDGVGFAALCLDPVWIPEAERCAAAARRLSFGDAAFASADLAAQGRAHPVECDVDGCGEVRPDFADPNFVSVEL